MAIADFKKIRTADKRGHFFLNSFVLSIIAHILILAPFIILIRPKPQSIKPSFTFLGSILQKNDLAINHPRNLTKPGIIRMDKTGLIIDNIKPSSSMQKVTKPLPSNALLEKKGTIKKSLVQEFIADDTSPHNPQKNQTKTKPSLPEIPPYESLKIYSYD